MSDHQAEQELSLGGVGSWIDDDLSLQRPWKDDELASDTAAVAAGWAGSTSNIWVGWVYARQEEAQLYCSVPMTRQIGEVQYWCGTNGR